MGNSPSPWLSYDKIFFIFFRLQFSEVSPENVAQEMLHKLSEA
jgi:hypothetical protein